MDSSDPISIKRRHLLSSMAFGLGALGVSRLMQEPAGAASTSGPGATAGHASGGAPPGDPETPLPTAAGQWWQYRGDQRLSGRSTLKGHIGQPTIEWSHSIAGRETLLAAALKEGPAVVRLPSSDLPPRDGQTPGTGPGPRPPTSRVPGSPVHEGSTWDQTLTEWRVGGPYGTSWFDLDGDGRLTPISRSYNQKVGKVLPDQAGLQLIETEAKGYPKVPGVYKGTVRLKVREKGQWVTRWEAETDTLIWQAEPIFGDFDGDGKNEIALLPWFRLTLLDAATGTLKARCNYLAEDESENPGEGGRAYGWFGAVDIDGDGQTEFIIIEDFVRYATVLGWRDGKLQRLWLKVWEPRKKPGQSLDPDEVVVVRVNPEPVQDVDADGRQEIIVSLFNLTGDNRWHVVILDALTGATKLDLPGQFLTGARDADGDGVPDLFCTAVDEGPRIPEPAALSISTLKGGSAARLWDHPGASFATYGIGGFPPHVNSGAALGSETILCQPVAPDGPGIFFTRKTLNAGSGEVELTCWQADPKKRFRPLAVWIGPALEPLMVRAGGEGAAPILLKAAAFEEEPARVRCPGKKAHTAVLASQRVPAPLSPAVAGRPEPGALPVAVVQGANETVEAFRPAAPGKTRRVWRVPGRGMTCNNYYEGALLTDLAGDGHLSVVVGTRGDRDCARLKVLSARDGKAIWSHDFPAFPGAPPPWNVPGLMYWQGGYSRDRRRMDLLVQLRRVHGETYLLDGRSGDVVWRQTRGRPGRDFGGWWMALYDFDGDGLEDILDVYPDMFCVARGRDGTLLVADESVRYVDLYAYFSDVLAADFLGAGRPQVLYLNEFVTALFTGRGERIWKLDHPHPGGWRNPAGFGDVDGDGRMALFFPGARGQERSDPPASRVPGGGQEFQCREAATGALKWSLPMPDEPSTFPAVADIDGDGRDECLFTVGNTLYAVGAAKTGSVPGSPARGAVLWKLDLPGQAGPVAIADVTGNGTAHVVVGCTDGHVYGIGPSRS